MRRLFCIWSFFMISIILFSMIPRIQGNPIPVYPNPSVNTLNICGLKKGSTIFIYSLKGVQLFQIANASYNQRIDISTLESGIYIIKLLSENEPCFIKMIKK